MKPKVLYHLTQEDFGPSLKVDRRAPKWAGKELREPVTPRLCTAPSAAQCLIARLFYMNKPVYIYKTLKPVKGVTPRDVWDSMLTDERWILPGQELVFHSRIPAKVVNDIQWWPCLYFGLQKSSDVKMRLAQLKVVRDVRPDFLDKRCEKLVRVCDEHFYVGDPYEYIIKESIKYAKGEKKKLFTDLLDRVRGGRGKDLLLGSHTDTSQCELSQV
jgi:hypothetical protein